MTNLSNIIGSNNILTENNTVTVTNKTFSTGNSIAATQLTGAMPALDGSALTNLSAGNLTGTLPSISGANLSNVNALYLGGQGAANYLRSNTSDNFTNGTLEFDDNTQLAFGSSGDTKIFHSTSMNPDVTIIQSITSNGGVLFRDGTNNMLDLAWSYGDQINVWVTMRMRDDTGLIFGANGDTRIKHLTNSYTEFVASSADGGMAFVDGSTICFDVAKTATDTTTFFQTIDVQGISKGTITTNTNGTLDLSTRNLFKCTPAGNITLTLSNPSVGQAGLIMLDNSGGHTISAHASLAINGDVLTALSSAGVYKLSYYCSASSGNNTILVGATGALT